MVVAEHSCPEIRLCKSQGSTTSSGILGKLFCFSGFWDNPPPLPPTTPACSKWLFSPSSASCSAASKGWGSSWPQPGFYCMFYVVLEPVSPEEAGGGPGGQGSAASCRFSSAGAPAPPPRELPGLRGEHPAHQSCRGRSFLVPEAAEGQSGSEYCSVRPITSSKPRG